MAFAGKGRLGKLCNEHKKAFDIQCRRRGAGSAQQRCGIIKQARKRKKNRERREKKEEDYERKWSELSSTPHLGGDEPRLSAHRGEGKMESSALALNYGPVARMALQKP